MDLLFRQLLAFWSGLTGAQRVAFVSVALITAGALTLILNFAGEQDYATLYSDLAPEDAAAITEELDGMLLSYRLTHAGTRIQVPADRVYDVRLDLASRGLPAAGPVGFEVFNDNALGMTPFQQRVQLRRALEGELSRTISRLASVDWSRVHINLPDRSVFQRDARKPSASVVLSLKGGRTPSGSEVAGITHLIAGAVEGIEARSVTVMDQKGHLLARPGSEEGEVMAGEVLDMQGSIEKRLADRAQSLLDATLGTGKSLVTVSAVIDRRRFEERKDRVNPDEAAVIREQRSEESRTTPPSSFGGVPGTPTNVPGPEGPGPSGADGTETVARETISFEVSRSTEQTIVPMGEITRLQVAVVVDGTYTIPEAAPAAEGAEEDEDPAPPQPVYVPRGQEELQQLAEIVKRAVGIDDTRGDVFEIQNLRFRSPLEDVAAEPLSYWRSTEFMLLLPRVSRGIAVIFGLLLLVLLVIRPTLRQLATVPALQEGGASASPDGTASIAPHATDEMAELAIPVTKEQAKDVAEAMKQWLRE